MFKDVASVNDILPGGMKAYEVNGKEIVLCNDSGRFYAFDRRCGHTSAPLEMGTLNGYILTCPMHSAQFDTHTGKLLCGPLLHYAGQPPGPKSHDNSMNWFETLLDHIKTYDIKAYAVKVEGDRVSVDL